MRFQLVTVPYGSRQSARFDESLIKMAAVHGPTACVWESSQGLVVPRTYQRYERFAAACDAFAGLRWPITVRLSGGGIVPQGPGIINLSLAYGVNGLPLQHSDAAYRLICGIIRKALEGYGIETRPSTASGSFCDGRYNLVCGQGDSEKKVAGTAQLWRRVKPSVAIEQPRHDAAPSGAGTQIVLVHALILAGVDASRLTDQVNLFEAAIGSTKRYDPGRVASLHECQGNSGHPRDAFTQSLAGSLLQELENFGCINTQ